MLGWLVFGIDLALGILVVECIALICLNLLTGKGPPLVAVLAMTMAGLTLILALRVLVGEGPLWLVALLLGLGGIAHLFDLAMRFRVQRSS